MSVQPIPVATLPEHVATSAAVDDVVAAWWSLLTPEQRAGLWVVYAEPRPFRAALEPTP